MPGITLKDIIFSSAGFKQKAVKLFDHLVGGAIALILPAAYSDTALTSKEHLKILIIRPGGIGDAVFLLPFIRLLKEKRHTINILCEQRNLGVFASQRDLFSQIYCYDTPSQLLNVFQQSYDVIVDTEQWHHLSAITAYFIKHKTTIGFSTRPSRARLIDIKIPYDLNAYELASFQKLFFPLIGDNSPALQHSFHLNPLDVKWAEQKINTPFIVLALGGSIKLRRFSIEQSLRICQNELNNHHAVVLLGGEDVAFTAHQIEKSLPNTHLINLTGKTTLVQSGALISKATRVFAQDSGLLHLAVAVGTPVTAFFGPGNALKWGPRGSEDIIINQNLPCSPCTRFGYTVCSCHNKFPCQKKGV